MYDGRALLATVGLVVAGVAPVAAAPPSAAAPRPAAVTAASPAGTPVVTSTADGEAMVFARGTDDTVYRRTHRQEDDSWSDWTSTGGAAAGDPVTARDLDKRPSVFVRRADGHLWIQRQKADGDWTAWGDLGTPPDTSVAGAPAVVANDNTYSSPSPNAKGFVEGNTDGRLELFVRGADSRLWHRVQKAPNGADWSKWEALPGTWAGSPAAVVAGDGRITVVARKDDGRLRVTAQKEPSTSQTPLPADNWPAWEEIGTGYTGNVSVAVNLRKAGTLLQVFGNRSDGRLWTTTQSAPGTPDRPAGVWATDKSQKIGPAVPGRPVVTTHTDGRLAVFGIDADDHVAYRTQTSSASATDPNGIWGGGWRALDDEKAQSVAVYSAPRGKSVGFDVFAVGKGSDTLYQRSRLAAGTRDGSREDVWLDWTDLAPIGSGPCAGPGSLECLTIENADLPHQVLSLENSLKPDTAVTRDPDRGLAWQQWSLRPTDDRFGAVTIVNRLKGKCVDEDDDVLGPYHLQLADCDPARKQQMWFIEPVLPDGADKGTQTPSVFRVRNRFDTARCLTALAEDVWPHTARKVERIACDTDADNDHNTWRLGSGGATAPGILGIVLKQAAERCAFSPDANKCAFVALQKPSAYRAAEGCVAGRVLYNQSPGRDAEYYITWSHTTGTEFSFGRTVGLSIEFLSTEFSASFSWLQESTTAEQVQVHVPPKQFGWVEIAPVLRETIGYWNITLDGHTWTVPGHNVSYAKDGTNGATTFTVARTSKTPPNSGHCDA
ncbi:hypothetical protein ACFPC0_02070 [Streptomyces andamanensis]|uniref:PLL-like beta propeller domain-containing protein n=1 Tax=Streptomyces andamanensis TaxID=1565035 RepID=A0ABV8T6Z3_9ACTN